MPTRATGDGGYGGGGRSMRPVGGGWAGESEPGSCCSRGAVAWAVVQTFWGQSYAQYVVPIQVDA